MTASYAWVRWLDFVAVDNPHGVMTEAIVQWHDGRIGAFHPDGGWLAVCDLSPVSGYNYRVYQTRPIHHQSASWRLVPLVPL